MPVFVHRSRIEAPAEAVFAWHARPGAFERLRAPGQQLRVIERAGGIVDGGRLTFELKLGPLWRRWVAVHRDYVQGRQFCDEQVAGPFRSWRHVHRVLPNGPDACWLEDEVAYDLPGGAIGRIFGNSWMRRALERMFSFRHLRTRLDLARHRRHADRGPLRVAVSGASGLVGTALVAFLGGGGHAVLPIVRRSPGGPEEIAWKPGDGSIESAKLTGADAVIHLAGANIAAGRWTAARKAEIRASRVESTRLLCQALAGLDRPPRTLISASATGFYGDRGDEVLTESSPAGVGFLPDVCREWEAATRPAEDAGVRVVHLRIGVVLSADGGALRTMRRPFSLGLGGRLGSGRQFMSWITLDDLVGLIHALLFADHVRGSVNAVTGAVTNREFAKTLGAAVRRPALLPLPAFALRALIGELADALLLASARVEPSRFSEFGFAPGFTNLREALRFELGC